MTELQESPEQSADADDRDIATDADDGARNEEIPPNAQSPVGDDVPAPPEEPESFPRYYVEKLRDEMAKYRQRARAADTLGQRLHAELVRATGRLADPTDLEYSEEHLEDPEALQRAIEDLLARKPHLASRKPVGEIGQGAAPSAGPVDLAGMLRQRAR